MTIAGVIAEYNPFHQGHALHLARTRALTGADYLIVVMSGNYVQRGTPAMFDKYTRAKAAIDECDYKRVLLSALLVLIYVFVLQPVGFIVSTLVYLPLQMLVLSPDDQRGKKQIIQLLIIDVIFTMIVFFLFRYGFKIVLPAGIFTINL